MAKNISDIIKKFEEIGYVAVLANPNTRCAIPATEDLKSMIRSEVASLIDTIPDAVFNGITPAGVDMTQIKKQLKQ